MPVRSRGRHQPVAYALGARAWLCGQAGRSRVGFPAMIRFPMCAHAAVACRISDIKDALAEHVLLGKLRTVRNGLAKNPPDGRGRPKVWSPVRSYSARVCCRACVDDGTVSVQAASARRVSSQHSFRCVAIGLDPTVTDRRCRGRQAADAPRTRPKMNHSSPR